MPRYLKKCEQHVFFGLSEIRGRLWAMFAFFVILDLEFRDTVTACVTLSLVCNGGFDSGRA